MLLIDYKTVDGVKGIKDKMGVHLSTQCLGFCHCQLFVKPGFELFLPLYSFYPHLLDEKKES